MRGETERMARELRGELAGADHLAGAGAGVAHLSSHGRGGFPLRRDDPGFDFSGPAAGYAKAVETEVKALVFPRLRKLLEREPPAIPVCGSSPTVD
jgi:hypothetical protein